MPNRILRDGILDSDRMERLVRDGGWAAEVFYRRLMSVADDYGRFDGRVSVIKARCYPTVLDSVRDADLVRWIAACEKASLIRVYSAQSKKYVCILDFNQQARAKSKYPAPEDGDDSPLPEDAQQMRSRCAADAQQVRTKSEAQSEAQSETKARDGAGTPAKSLSPPASPDADPGKPPGRANAPPSGENPPRQTHGGGRNGHPPTRKPPGSPSPPSVAAMPIAADPEGIGLLPTEIGPKAASPPTESERAAALAAFDQWSAMARGYPVKTHENEHRPIREMLEALSLLPPLIFQGQQVPRHRLVPKAVEILKANATPFKNPKWACGCVKNKLADWEAEGVPGPGGRRAEPPQLTPAQRAAAYTEEY